ncbi:MAG TPA: 6-phosphogluconolactonase [Blastocatellia bacterium]|nr:6-phosphogluconolactonase [Blastocatellia bacterium]
MQTRIYLAKGLDCTLQVYDDADQLAAEAARLFTQLASESVERSDRFNVALSGGNTPIAMFIRLAQEPYCSAAPWKSTHVFWADERCVPPDDPDSNYRLAVELLLSRVPIPAGNIHRVPAEMPDHDSAAAQYSENVRAAFARDQHDGDDANSLPRFDLVTLGLGDDGHTASLFPHSAALKSGQLIAVANYVEKLRTSRITLTPAVINKARNVIFLVAGDNKALALKHTLEDEYQPEAYPAQLIRPTKGTLLWMVDVDSAGLLSDDKRLPNKAPGG